MIDPQLAGFIGVVISLTMIPSATTLLITRSVVGRGQKAGFWVILGGSVGVYIHAVLSALGLSLILVQPAQLFAAVKLLGAVYLIGLGVQSIWRGLHHDSALQAELAGTAGAGWKAWAEGFTTLVLSPETSIFYLAMLPQFIHPGESVLGQSLMLASLHVLIRLGWYSLLIVCLGQVTAALIRPHIKRWLEFSSGVALVLFGFKVATAKR